METSQKTRRRWIRRTIAAGAVCALIACLAVALWTVRTRPGPAPEAATTDVHEVPLGVEGAVVITYAGPRLVARPYRRGASIIVRIANEAQRGAIRVYDVRFVVNQPSDAGEGGPEGQKALDLADYLTSADGTPLADLPSFKVKGQTRLTRDIETRIREIEDVGIDISHYYYETLAGLGVFWGLWLLGLIFIGRPKRAPKPVPPPPEPSLAELIARYFAALGGGDLPASDKARLEALLLRHWRRRLGLTQERMAESCRQMERNAAVGAAYDALEAWLHAPSVNINPAEVIRRCEGAMGH